MPVYEYQCKSCGATFEREQGMNDAPVKECPDCKGEVRRLISGGGFLFKGKTHGDSCSLETSGRTCCGRDERCGSPSCGS
ncbi:MAG TPA: zinc ribbon domain-containing protein [Candidatus Sumerlaeota bacterium]|nr:zinc ribbon domain-containing protein [Candidatus Sumerlaeota bacterium]HRR30106.1 zinc ribbon domain-containing protein [Candidatus Sumerlaeia bacterium]HON49767.1 zinc ribbon domain-containing protein [Candidatus Sumerlaeota bacterium]HOR63985.1 zinc ribbon domain-containing protein [Candidatus Sumerlaeota bacterium]HPL75205.1 zinc ribbon domain-containing protein [Candidatus Sumerlaeota bacterium]